MSDKEKWNAFVAKIDHESTHRPQKLHKVYKEMDGTLNGKHTAGNVKLTILKHCQGDSAFMEKLLKNIDYADKHFEDKQTLQKRDPTASNDPYFEASAEEEESEEEN